MKIAGIILIFVSAFLSLKHGWDAFQTPTPEQAKTMANLGITQTAMPYLGAFSIIVGLMLFFPQTFLLGNILNAVTIVLIMALSLHAGDHKMALVEIPFLALPLVLIWLKYPIKF